MKQYTSTEIRMQWCGRSVIVCNNFAFNLLGIQKEE